MRIPTPLGVALAACLSLTACETTENVAETTAEGAEDGAQAVAGAADTAFDATTGAVGDAAEFVYDAAGVAVGAVTDAAGTVYRSARDLFTDDPEAVAVALVRPTSARGAQVQGTVRFREDDGDLMAVVSLRGLDAGAHGVHVHQNPSCGMGDPDNDGMMEAGGAAGGHWDPMNTDDHGAPGDDMGSKHLGDLGNVTARADGTVETTITVEDFDRTDNLAGHSVIVHSDRDDLESDPGGSSGMRLGCGAIEGR